MRGGREVVDSISERDSFKKLIVKKIIGKSPITMLLYSLLYFNFLS